MGKASRHLRGHGGAKHRRRWLPSGAWLLTGVVLGALGAGLVSGSWGLREPGREAAPAMPGPSGDAAEPSGKGVPPPPESQKPSEGGSGAAKPYRAFEPRSWWNTRLPRDAALHPQGEEILDYLRTAPESGRGCLVLAGAGDGSWGQPVYWSRPSDTEYDVEGVSGDRPPELDNIRIPQGAKVADNNDGSMTVFDLDRGYVAAFTDGQYDEEDDSWSASGATVTYLNSNGLHARTGRSDDPRNRGTHRGNNGATMMVTRAEVEAGSIRHVLKIASGPQVSEKFIFPMVGSDGDYEGDDPAVPPQGLRLRIRPDVDLERLVSDPEARVIARALQRYGMYIGDSGGATALKLEDTGRQGLGQMWDVAADALCAMPFSSDFWDVIAEDYEPSR